MASVPSQGTKLINKWRRTGCFDKGIGAQLPIAYRKFWREWKILKPAAVHYVPETEKWKKDDITGEVKPVQEVPIPIIYPEQHNDGLWGGEGVIKGFQKRNPLKRRVPHFWVPILRRSVVFSEVLNQYISVTITDRTMRLIHDNYGFDHYLLKTPACDLKSTLALTLKRKILHALQNNCPAYDEDKTKQVEVYEQYQQYLSAYTEEEIEWYGLTFFQACEKLIRNQQSLLKIKPQKLAYRSELLEKLKDIGIKEALDNGTASTLGLATGETSWISKINPFGKKHET